MSASPQGPCVGNQQSLAHSRLWDAVVGFLHVFANMQMKLSQVPWPVLDEWLVQNAKSVPLSLVLPLWIWLLGQMAEIAMQMRSHF